MKKQLSSEPDFYQNTTLIDKYLDNYWMVKCPDTYSVSDVNQAVYTLFHQIFIIGNEAQEVKAKEEEIRRKQQIRMS